MGLLLALLGLSNITGCADVKRDYKEICGNGSFTQKQRAACEVGVKLAHQGDFQNIDLISNHKCAAFRLRRHLKLSKTEDVQWAKTVCVHGFIQASKRKASYYAPSKVDSKIVQLYESNPDKNMSLPYETSLSLDSASQVSAN